ncbi:MAG: zf-HC2 domain-containing protein [Candidatus Binatia bacterium]|nr:zf-HC2 domain-containing protein [Candidatus Binatia bacterium]
MSCEELREELVGLLDGELDPAATVQVEAHLEICGGCAAEHRELVRTQALLEGALAAEPPARPRFDELWAAADGPSEGSRRASDARPPSWARGAGDGRRGARRGGLVPIAFAAAAAAALFFYQLIPSAPPVTGPTSAPAPLVAVAETAPPVLPPELVEHPDMFVDFVIVRRLEKLRQLPALLDSPGAEGREAEVGRT